MCLEDAFIKNSLNRQNADIILSEAQNMLGVTTD